MKSLVKLTFLALLGTFVFATAASSAAAAPLPEPADPAIVPVRSLGGVKLGGSVKAADRRWGKRGECSSQFCTYGGEGQRGSAFITKVGSDGVSSARIAAGTKRSGKPAFKGPLMRFEATGKKKRRVGLGSSLRDVERAFPEAHRTEAGVELRGSGRSRLSFVAGDGPRVTVIELSAR